MTINSVHSRFAYVCAQAFIFNIIAETWRSFSIDRRHILHAMCFVWAVSVCVCGLYNFKKVMTLTNRKTNRSKATLIYILTHGWFSHKYIRSPTCHTCECSLCVGIWCWYLHGLLIFNHRQQWSTLILFVLHCVKCMESFMFLCCNCCCCWQRQQ